MYKYYIFLLKLLFLLETSFIMMYYNDYNEFYDEGYFLYYTMDSFDGQGL